MYAVLFDAVDNSLPGAHLWTTAVQQQSPAVTDLKSSVSHQQLDDWTRQVYCCQLFHCDTSHCTVHLICC